MNAGCRNRHNKSVNDLHRKMSIQKQPKLLLLIYALVAILAGTLAILVCLNPWAPETIPVAVRCDAALVQANLSLKGGHVIETERLCLDALKMIETSSDEFQRARVLHALGLTYMQEKKLPAAEQTLRKALASLDQVIAKNGQTAPNKPTVDNLRSAQQKYAVIEGDLASVLSDLSRYSEAESAYKSALKRNDLYLGNLEVQSNLSNNLAKVLLKNGKNAAAEELEIEGEANELSTKDLLAEVNMRLQELAAGKITRPIQKPLLSVVYVGLAECYVAQKLYVEAESNYNKSLEVCERNLKSVPNDPNRCALASALKEAASNYVMENKYDLAFPAFKRALSIWETVVHPPAWAKPATEITSTRVLLANAYRAQEKSKVDSTKATSQK